MTSNRGVCQPDQVNIEYVFLGFTDTFRIAIGHFEQIECAQNSIQNQISFRYDDAQMFHEILFNKSKKSFWQNQPLMSSLMTPTRWLIVSYLCIVSSLKKLSKMNTLNKSLPDFLSKESRIGNEISITGKWVAAKESGFFRKSAAYKEMLKEWDGIHHEAKMHEGMLSTEINPAIGQDAVLIHHVFEDAPALVNYFKTTAEKHRQGLTTVAKPDIQLIRGVKIDDNIKQALADKRVKGSFGEYLFGYVKNDYQKPDPESAVQVTAKWTCKDQGTLEELIYWWQQVGTDAYSMEKGLVRFEVYQVMGENALIIHETFVDSNELQFHLTKGTAEKYKKDIDKIAFPENYFFRGPVSWLIRTYSKFMNLPATYTGQGSHYTQEGGTMSEGIINHKNKSKMTNQEVMVVYKWTAKAGESMKLQAIYKEVLEQMESNEPGAKHVECYFDVVSSTLVVMDLFADAGAVGFHLGTTAAGHFEHLLQIATPGEFLFCGDVPEEMKQAAVGMGLNATFAPRIFGFNRKNASE